MNSRPNSLLQRVGPYLLVCVAVTIATLARLAAQPLLQETSPYSFYYLAVMTIAWFFGLYPGLVATALSAALGAIYFLPPANSLYDMAPQYRVAILLFAVVGVFCSFVSESLRRARRLAVESQAQLQAILDNTPAMVYLQDAAGAFVLVNNSFARTLGLPLDSIIGKKPKDIGFGWSPGTKPISQTEPVAARRSLHLHGVEKIYQTLTFPLRNTLGQTYAVGCIATDVTEQRNLEQQFIHAQRMESVGTLAGGIAHDFNNLLTAVMGFAELAQLRVEKSNPVAPYLDKIRAAGEKATRLTSQLLMFAKKQFAAPEIVDINETIRQMLPLFEGIVGSDVEIKFLPAEPLWQVHIDQGQLEQVLTNLVLNARDAMPNGGRLLLLTRNEAEKDSVSLEVTDTGTGFTDEVAAKMFDPFFTTKELGKGTGLGLAICYGIVTQHGGAITANSKTGEGTTIRVTLPRASRPEDTQSVETIASAAATILVAKSDDAARTELVAALGDIGYRVLEARDEEGALQIARAHTGPLDLIISDYPGIRDSLHTARPAAKILSLNSTTPEAAIAEVRHAIAG